MGTDRPVYIFSDIHLDHPYCDYDGFVKAIAAAENKGAQVILDGDTLDCWYRKRQIIEVEHFELLQRIKALLLVNVVGNHDSPVLHGPSFLWPLQYPSAAIEVGDRIWYIEHGHLRGRWGKLFVVLDKLDEKPWFSKIGRWFVRHEFLRMAGRNTEDEGYREKMIEAAKVHGASVVIAGHTHRAEVYRDLTGEREVTYVNPGSALGRISYAIYDGDFRIVGDK